MSTKTASPRALLSIALILGGGVAVLIGALFLVMAFYTVASGGGFIEGHIPGALLLFWAVIFGAGGAWAFRKGRKTYVAVSS